MIDGPVYKFPLYSTSGDDMKELSALYRETFGEYPPKGADYAAIYAALEDNEPIEDPCKDLQDAP